MTFGIIEPTGTPRPGGTILLASDMEDNVSTTYHDSTEETRRTSGNPLHWSRPRKEFAFLTIVLGCCACGVIGPLLVPGFNIVAKDLGVALTQMSLLNGSLVMGLGVSSYVCNALAVTYGTRLIFLVTTLSMVVTSCWGGAAKFYTSLLAARIFQGLGMGSWFALAGTASITQMFHVHERGRRVGLWNFAVIVSVNVAPIISGRVIVALTWRWSFWLLAITFGVVLFLTVFLFPETSYIESPTSLSTTSMEPSSKITDHETNSLHKEKELTRNTQELLTEEVGLVIEAAPAWKRVLGVRGVHMGSFSQALRGLVTPLSLLLHPAVVWGCLMWMVTFTWVIIQGAIAAQVWSAPPYNMSPTAVGNLVGIAPLIGSALGCVLGGIICDWFGQYMSKKNGGVYEPEFRLLTFIPTILIFAIGIFGLGESLERGASAIVTAVFLAILNFAVGIGCTGIVSYTNDTCQRRAAEAFGLAMIVKSAFAFGLTFILNDYLAENGPRVFFATWGGLTLGVMLLTIPMYVWGKEVRAWSDKRSLI